VRFTVELTHATALFTGVADGDLGRTQGDTSPQVECNRASLLASLGLGAISVPAQVHGSTVATARAAGGYSVGAWEADALLCSEPDAAVAVHVADCLPIVVAGPGALAVIHAGWRGLAGGVIEAAVARLRELTDPTDAAIGPGAGACCYEAGPEVHAAFARYNASRGALLDLRAVATAKLEAIGVACTGNVDVCTICAPVGQLFSHRREGPQTGRQAGLGWLR
jgi:YfiH family protein